MRPLLLLALLPTFAAAQAPPPVTTTGGMVVCVSPPAADVGTKILDRGGNAVDAAVAVGFAEAVTWPEAGNVGGGGFMLLWPGEGKDPVVIDYRETAPAAATADMFAAGVNRYSPAVAGVPGTVRGLALAHRKFGKLPWKDVVLPAVELAEKGFVVNGPLAKALNRVLADKETKDPEFRRVYGKADGREPWRDGDTLTLPDLGKTLRAVAETGPDAFYTGELAGLFEKTVKAGGGRATAADLGKYQAKERTPVRGTYRGYEVVGLPPPSSGGTALIQMLNILETFDLSKQPRHSPTTVHLMAEAMRRVYRDRAAYLGDPAFTDVPAKLLTKEYAKTLAAGIDPRKATLSASLAGDIPLAPESDQTTHYSVVDAAGMAVSNTYTLEAAFGCRVVVKGAGYILNNEMTDFNPKPGVTDRTGRVGTKPNLIAPGKRMLSSQCPAMLAKDGKLVLVTGSPGGRTIPNTVLNVVVNVVDYRMPVQQAVNAPRLHHQWFPDRALHEEFAGFADLAAGLRALGHEVRPHRQGDAHSIAVDPVTGVRTAGVDRRLDGKAAVSERK